MFWKRRKSRNADLDRELRSHLDLEAQEQQDRGLSREDARYAAKRALGNQALVKEDVRATWRWNAADRVWQDLRYSARVLRKSPGFAVTAVLTLALGIGASTAVFTVVDSVLLQPLSYRHSSRLVALWERVQFLPFGSMGPNPHHEDLWQKRATAFSGITLIRNGAEGLRSGVGHPRLTGTVLCQSNLFDVLQIVPMLGRNFRPEDDVQGHDHVAIITYSLWKSLFHGDPSVIGKTLRLADVPRQVIGVLPSNFRFPKAFRSKPFAGSAPQPAIFVPAALNLNDFSWNGDYGNWTAIARLKPGVNIRQADAQLNAIQAQILKLPAYSGDRQSGTLTASVQPLQEAVVAESQAGLWLLMAAVLAFLLIACLNLANAQFARALSRQREAAVRAALGASKLRLLWHSLTENLVLGAVGGLGGVLLAIAGVNLFRHYAPLDLPRISDIYLNWAVLLFAAGLTLTSSIFFGVLPGLRLLRIDPQAALQQSSSRTLGARQGRRIRNGLVGLQVFGCTVLLLVTALFSENLFHLLHEQKGFDTGHVALAEVRLPHSRYKESQTRAAFDGAVLTRLRAIPGVQFAGLINVMPLTGSRWIEGMQRVDRPRQKTPLINLRWVSAGYFEAMREHLVAGRFFEQHDRTLKSAILSQGEAKALFGNRNPIGGHVETEGRKFTVIGVVADSRTTSLKSALAKMAYLDYTDRPQNTAVFVARGKQPADQLVASMRHTIWSYAPEITITWVTTLSSQLSDSLAAQRFQTLVLLSFGIAALLLAMLGIYGVLSYSTEMRKREIGMRMALGATRRGIYSLTFREAAVPVLAGLAAGLIASTLAARLVRSLLYGVQNVNAPAMLIVAALFLAAAVAAAFLPARRAATIDPMSVLRHE
ncbi:MAG: ADOP family duplicated permease [Bryobacteraceae bacterium]